jgi:hypothetical protein
MTMLRIKYWKTSAGNYRGRCGDLFIFFKIRRHGKWDGFDRRISWWSGWITGLNGKFYAGEGWHGSSLSTLRKAKKWANKKALEYQKKMKK